MNQEYLNKLARLAVVKGVNVQPGQLVVVNADLEARELARQVCREAYAAGASEVIMNYSDEVCALQTYLHADPAEFDHAPYGKAVQLNTAAEKGAAFIHIISDDPDLFAQVDPSRPAARHKALRKEAAIYRNGLDTGKNAWTIIAAASPAWAKKVYPDLGEEDAVEALWNDIFTVSRIDDNDPEENWKQHDASFQHRLEKLNTTPFRQFHYTSSNGTDLRVDLNKGTIFEGGSSLLADGTRVFCNIPTEEIFTAPRKEGVNGTLHAVMPLSLDGKLIEDFSFEFKDGKVVDFKAGKGYDTLKVQLDMDEGARYLGEMALVPYDSPIRRLNRIFYNTLIDENASCHFALGQSYQETIEGGLSMSKDELLAHGMNQSDIHIDFMVGAPDLHIDGILDDGTVIPVFENGSFSSWFDDPKQGRVK